MPKNKNIRQFGIFKSENSVTEKSSCDISKYLDKYKIYTLSFLSISSVSK